MAHPGCAWAVATARRTARRKGWPGHAPKAYWPTRAEEAVAARRGACAAEEAVRLAVESGRVLDFGGGPRRAAGGHGEPPSGGGALECVGAV